MSKQHPKQKPSPKKVTPKQKNTRTVTAPVAKASVMRTTEPKFHQSPPGTVVVSKTEYIGEVNGTTNPYGVTAEYAINPGSPATFPWASGMAGLYESYRFKKLSFHYRPEAPTTDTGYVGIIVDYNPLDPPPISKVVAMDFEESVRGPPWTHFDHYCSQKNLNKRKSYFNRRNDEEDGFDPLLYDVGTLYVVAGGNTASTPRGELWVDYVIEFLTPELDSGATVLDGQVYVTAIDEFHSGSINNLDGLAARVVSGANIFSQITYDAPATPVTTEEKSIPPASKGVKLEEAAAPDFVTRDPVEDNYQFLDPTVELATPTNPTRANFGFFNLTGNKTYFVNLVFDLVSGESNFSGLTLTANVSSGGSVIQLGQVTNNSAGYIGIFKITTGPLRNPLLWFTFGGTISLGGFLFWKPSVFIRQALPELSPPVLVPTLTLSAHKLMQTCHRFRDNSRSDTEQVLLSTPGREPTNRITFSQHPQQSTPDYVHLRRAYEELKKEDFRDFAKIAKG